MSDPVVGLEIEVQGTPRCEVADHDYRSDVARSCPDRCSCGHHGPSLEHAVECPARLRFYGGDPDWGVGTQGDIRTKRDGTRFKWSTLTWMPDHDHAEPATGSHMVVTWGLRCRRCGPMVLSIIEDTPTVYRFCPLCGERALVQDDGAEDELARLPVKRAPRRSAP